MGIQREDTVKDEERELIIKSNTIQTTISMYQMIVHE